MPKRLSCTALAMVLMACGGSSTNPADGGTGNRDLTSASDDLRRDVVDGGAVADGGGAEDAGARDGSTAPSGALLKGSYTLVSETQSGLLIVTDSTGALSAVDEKTGAVTAITSKADGGARAIGDVVFVSHDVTYRDMDGTGYGGLGVWTSAGGYHDLGVDGANLLSLATDGTHIVFNHDNALDTYGFVTGGFVGLNTVTNSGFKLLVTGERYNGQFLIENGKVVIGHSLPDPPADDVGDITAYDLSSGAATSVLSNVGVDFVANAQNTALVASPGGYSDASVVDFSTGKIWSGFNIAVAGAAFSVDGTTLFALPLSSAGLPLAIPWSVTDWMGTLLHTESGAGGFEAASPDGKYVLFQNQNGPLQLVPTSGTTAFRAFSSRNGSFSPDSGYIVLADLDPTTSVSTLQVAPVASGSPATVSTTVTTWSFYGKDQLLVFDNQQVSGTHTNVDVAVVALATPTVKNKIAAQVDYRAILSNDGKTLYYSTGSDATKAGIYKLTLP